MFYQQGNVIRAWYDEKARSPLGNTYADTGMWGSFWNSISKNYEGNNKPYVQSFTDHLLREGALKAGDSVLDIGCGPGTYAFPFLKAGAAAVECIDSTEGMLQALKERAVKGGLLNRINIRHVAWMEYQSDKRFDLVFSSMSPAISEYEELMRMERFSGKYCALVTYANGGDEYPLRDKLWLELRGEKLKSNTFDVIYPFNILYALNRHPNLKTLFNESEKSIPLDEAYQYYLQYFHIFGYDGDAYRDKIYKRLKQEAKDGICREQTKTYISLIWWKPDDRQ